MSGPRKRKSYTPMYRAEAARLVIDTGRPIERWPARSASGNSCWAAGSPRYEPGRMPPPALDVDERAELERLRVEVAELRMDRAFLKKATAFFVTENQNR